MGLPMSTAAVKDRLKAVPLLARLGDKELDLLASAARHVSYRKNARIFEEGSSADCCYVLTSGRTKVVLNSEDGAEVLLGDLAEGDMVGELALLDGFARSAALVAIEPCCFLLIPAPAFERLRANVAFERKLVAQLADPPGAVGARPQGGNRPVDRASCLVSGADRASRRLARRQEYRHPQEAAPGTGGDGGMHARDGEPRACGAQAEEAGHTRCSWIWISSSVTSAPRLEALRGRWGEPEAPHCGHLP